MTQETEINRSVPENEDNRYGKSTCAPDFWRVWWQSRIKGETHWLRFIKITDKISISLHPHSDISFPIRSSRAQSGKEGACDWSTWTFFIIHNQAVFVSANWLIDSNFWTRLKNQSPSNPGLLLGRMTVATDLPFRFTRGQIPDPRAIHLINVSLVSQIRFQDNELTPTSVTLFHGKCYHFTHWKPLVCDFYAC